MLSDFTFNISVRSKVGVYLYPNILVLANFNDQSVHAIIDLKVRVQVKQRIPLLMIFWANGTRESWM